MATELVVDELTQQLSQLQIQPKKKRDYPLYWCIKIEPEIIKSILSEITPEDIAHIKIQEAFHITLLFNRLPPTEETLKKYSDIIGKQIELTIDGYAIDEKGCALIINQEFEHRELCTNEHPHISIGNIIGTKPVYNNLLVGRALKGESEFTGKLKIFETKIKIVGAIGAV